jgi:hypothetical protein
MYMYIWVSESLLFNAKWAIIQPYHGKKKLNIRRDDAGLR